MIHRILFFTLIMPSLLVFSILAILFKNSRKYGPDFFQRMGSKFIVLLSGARLEVDLSAIPEGCNPVFMVNHMSNLDIPVTVAALEKYVIKFVAKKSLFDIPFLGASMRAAGHISIDRSNRRSGMKSIEKAVEIAQTGVSPLLFPEGTRNKNSESLGDFKIGGIILALKCSVPVVPVVMAGMDRQLPIKSLWVNPGPVLIKALPPVDVSRYTLKERNKFKEDLYEAMNSTYKELKAELDARR